ncbi:DUF5926 family protein [Allokutzneria albata]|uniref:SEC-C motif-containing protein n=1 Tax=Allokutzneria albata TaxID=211114 RepID=A0A1H0A4L8_ALLAB|nr:DUF5926 family protein [Allokutzneria albata]SDN28498.1 SEC-C motif-containing protein [Allokutzneria albata]
MAKRAAAKRKGRGSDAVEGAVNARQPCPCGSGKRYKACHGSSYGPADVIVTRPFDGLAAECELIALREFVPSATAPLTLKEQGERTVTLATVLPMAAAALVRSDGEAFVGMQVQTRSGDISADLGRSIRWALTAEPGDVLTVAGDAREEARLQDVLAADAGLDVTVHSDFAWWIPGDDEPTGEVALSLQRANEAIMPTERVTGVTAAYWVDAGDKAHIRWVRPEPEEKLLAAMARLSAKGELDLGENTRYAGCFRAHGLLVPVWDIDREMHAKEWEQPVVELGKRLDAALATIDGEPLTEAERRSRDGLRGRQVTLR